MSARCSAAPRPSAPPAASTALEPRRSDGAQKLLDQEPDNAGVHRQLLESIVALHQIAAARGWASEAARWRSRLDEQARPPAPGSALPASVRLLQGADPARE